MSTADHAPAAEPRAQEPINQQGRPHRRTWMAIFDVSLLALAALHSLLVAFDLDGLPRVLATLAFACLVPGGALVTRLPFREPDEVLAMTVALSLAILAAASLLLVWLRAWHPLWLMAGLTALSIPVLALDLRTQLAASSADDLTWPAT